jgi:PAS domain S-box-containing protein
MTNGDNVDQAAPAREEGAAAPVRVLVVDDRPENLLALGTILEAPDRELVLAGSGRDALRELLRQSFALVLLDVNMPQMDGFETAQLIRSRPSSAHTPIIFVTAHHDDVLATRSYALGAVDYISAPVNPDVLRAKAGVFVELFRKTEENRRQAELLRRAEERLRLQAEEKLRQADERLRLIVESLVNYAVFSLDTGGRIATWNAGAERLFGYPAADAIGSDGGVLFARTTPAEAEAAGQWREALEGRRVEVEGWFERRDGRRFFGRGVITPMRSPDGVLHGYSNVVHDATERKQAEEALAHQAEQLREANRLKDEFLAVLSHELRTPLNAILGWTYMLRREHLKPEVASQALETIARNGEVQLALINDILDVSRFVAGKLRLALTPIDLRDAAAAACETATIAARAKGVDLQADLGEEPLPVNGDADRLQQVVWNLLSNAVKFTPAGGHVQLRTAQDGSEVTVSVSDDGAGIPASFVPHVFERFRQADSSSARVHGGLGLGLAIVHHLVELHGGRVSARSEGEGRGATFEVTLPAYVAGRRLARVGAGGAARDKVLSGGWRAEAAETDRPRMVPGVRCLVVDDDPDGREVLRATLERQGMIVSVACSAGDALEQLGSAQMLLADIGMPGEDGYALIRQVRQLPPERGGRIPAIAVTAYASEPDRERALAAGFDRHLAKPVPHDQLIDTISALLKETGTPGTDAI